MNVANATTNSKPIGPTPGMPFSPDFSPGPSTLSTFSSSPTCSCRSRGTSTSAIKHMAFTLTASLLMRPVGALLFGLMGDRYGRRIPSDGQHRFLLGDGGGVRPRPELPNLSYAALALRRRNGWRWGLGASLAMESVSSERRGLLSGILQEGYALGNLLAAVAFWTVFPHWGWRPMFFLGVVPALLTLFILSKVKESRSMESRCREEKGLGQLLP